jgi:hypothetical protein
MLRRYELLIFDILNSQPIVRLRNFFEEFGRVYEFYIALDPRCSGSLLGYLTFFNCENAYAVTTDRRVHATFRSGLTVQADNLQFGTTGSEVSAIFSPQALADPPLKVEIVNQGENCPVKASLHFLTPEAAVAATKYENQQFVGKLKLICHFPGVHDH